jgi:hypothetical protein
MNSRRAFLLLVFAVAAAAFASLSSTASHAEDKMVLGARQFEADKSGKGAVLCIWSVYMSIQTHTRLCNLERKPVDDAIDKAITTIDDFIIQNSSLHPTPSMLQDFKRRTEEADLQFIQSHDPTKERYCHRSDLAEKIRSLSPEQIDQNVKELLATPREPTANPCL